MPGSKKNSPASSWAKGLRQTTTARGVQRPAGAWAAGLHSHRDTSLPARPAGAWARGLDAGQQLCPADATRVEPAPFLKPLGPPTKAYVDLTDASNIAFLVKFAQANLWEVAQLNEARKQQHFLRSTRATLAILLYEFATGTGPTDRAFEEQHAIVKSLKEQPSTGMALDDFYERNKGLSRQGAQPRTYGYQFSPGLSLEKFGKSVMAHRRALNAIIEEGSFLQLFLGGVTYALEPKGGLIDITISDAKGRSTWYLHASSFWDRAKNVERNSNRHFPQPLSTIKQSYHFQVPLEEHRLFTMEQWLNNARNEAGKILRLEW